jgi:hypothetical protein
LGQSHRKFGALEVGTHDAIDTQSTLACEQPEMHRRDPSCQSPTSTAVELQLQSQPGVRSVQVPMPPHDGGLPLAHSLMFEQVAGRLPAPGRPPPPV